MFARLASLGNPTGVNLSKKKARRGDLLDVLFENGVAVLVLVVRAEVQKERSPDVNIGRTTKCRRLNSLLMLIKVLLASAMQPGCQLRLWENHSGLEDADVTAKVGR